MFNITLKNLRNVESVIEGVIENQEGCGIDIASLSKKEVLDTVDGWVEAGEHPSGISKALIEEIAEIIHEHPSYCEAKDKAYDKALESDEFEKELRDRVRNQVSNLKVKMPDDSTSEDIEQEIFGECDHLEQMLEEIDFDHENYQNFPGDLRDIQGDAVFELRDYFDC